MASEIRCAVGTSRTSTKRDVFAALNGHRAHQRCRAARCFCMPRPLLHERNMMAMRNPQPAAVDPDPVPPTRPLPDLPDEPLPTPLPGDPPIAQPGEPSA